jgi:hypothetical protein
MTPLKAFNTNPAPGTGPERDDVLTNSKEQIHSARIYEEIQNKITDPVTGDASGGRFG